MLSLCTTKTLKTVEKRMSGFFKRFLSSISPWTQEDSEEEFQEVEEVEEVEKLKKVEPKKGLKPTTDARLEPNKPKPQPQQRLAVVAPPLVATQRGSTSNKSTSSYGDSASDVTGIAGIAGIAGIPGVPTSGRPSSGCSSLPRYPKKAIPLIHQDRQGNYTQTPESVRLFQTFPKDMQLIIYGITGNMRSGKSFFLQLMMSKHGFTREESRDSFKVSSSSDACTKGIMGLFIPPPRNNKVGYLYLDSEGFGDTKDGDLRHELLLFILQSTLCSVNVINIPNGVITNTTLQQLSNVASVAPLLLEQKEAGNWSEVAADLLFLIRDWGQFDLPERFRSLSSATEYLKKVMDEATNFQDVVAKIRGLFRSLTCMTLPIPVLRFEEIKDLKNTPLGRTTPQFQASFEALARHLFLNTKPKSFRGTPLNGESLNLLIQSYLKSFNDSRKSGGDQLLLPSIGKQFQYVVDLQNGTLVEQALWKFMKIFFQQVQQEQENCQEAVALFYQEMQTLQQQQQKQSWKDWVSVWARQVAPHCITMESSDLLQFYDVASHQVLKECTSSTSSTDHLDKIRQQLQACCETLQKVNAQHSESLCEYLVNDFKQKFFPFFLFFLFFFFPLLLKHGDMAS